MKSEREYRLELERQPIQAGRIANTSKPFHSETEWPQPTRFERLTDYFSPDFWAFLGTAIVTICLGLLAIWVAL